MTVVYLNGAFVVDSEARIPVNDQAVLFGRGIYETFRARQGTVFLLDRHIARLREGASVVGIEVPPVVSELVEIVRELADRCGIEDARIRLTLTAGPPGGQPSLVIQAREATDYPAALYERGMTTVVADMRRNETSPLSRVKSLNCLDSILSREQAVKAGADTGVLLNTQGNVAEASTANVFIARGGALLTPPVEDGALPGVTRSFVLQEASEATLTLNDVLSADEVFLTGAVMGVMPLVRVGDRVISDAKPRNVTQRVRQRYETAARTATVASP